MKSFRVLFSLGMTGMSVRGIHVPPLFPLRQEYRARQDASGASRLTELKSPHSWQSTRHAAVEWATLRFLRSSLILRLS